MKFIKTKKGLALLAVLAVVAISAVGAFAYFTTTGTGTGTASVGTSTAWTVGESGIPSGGPLYPDHTIGTGHIQTDGYTVTNPGSGSQNLTSVAISVANDDGSPWTSGTCSASDFSVGGAPVGATYTDTALAGDFTAGQSKTTGTVTVQMIDSGSNQNDCKNATVPLYFVAS